MTRSFPIIRQEYHKKNVVKLEGNEIISTDDCDIFYSYYVCSKTESERRNAVFQDIVKDNGQTEMLLNTG